MDDKDKKGWELAWSGVALIALNAVLSALTITPETFGLRGALYYVLIAAMIVVDVVMVYHVFHKFFGRKK